MLYKEGSSLAEIAKAARLSTSEVSRRIRRISPGYAQPASIWRPKKRRAFVRLIEGKTLRQLEKELGVPYRTLWGWFSAMHPDYDFLSRRGAFAPMRDFFKSRKPATEPYEEMVKWLFDNLQRTLEAEAQEVQDSRSCTHSLSAERRQDRQDKRVAYRLASERSWK